MSKKIWIPLLVGVGVVIAIVIGIASNSQTVAERRFCDDLDTLAGSITTLTTIDPSSGSSLQFQNGVAAVQSAWGNVQLSGQHLSSVNMDTLDNAWNDFSEAVQSVPESASISSAEQAISESAQGLQSAVKSGVDSYDCST